MTCTPPDQCNGRDRAMAQRLSNEDETTGQSAENAMAQQDQTELASSQMKYQHPMDPHEPNFSELLPLPLRPYPSFEGWFIRILDPATKFSAAVILATNYATGESEVTILFALGTNEIDDSLKCGYTYAVAVKTKLVEVQGENRSFLDQKNKLELVLES